MVHRILVNKEAKQHPRHNARISNSKYCHVPVWERVGPNSDRTPRVNTVTNPLTNESTNRSRHQSNNQPSCQPINQSTHQSANSITHLIIRSFDQSIAHYFSQLINQPTNPPTRYLIDFQSINQSSHRMTVEQVLCLNKLTTQSIGRDLRLRLSLDDRATMKHNFLYQIHFQFIQRHQTSIR